MGSPPRILFLDQSGELGGAELCLADLAEASGKGSAVLLFQDGPFKGFLSARNIAVPSRYPAQNRLSGKQGCELFELSAGSPRNGFCDVSRA